MWLSTSMQCNSPRVQFAPGATRAGVFQLSSLSRGDITSSSYWVMLIIFFAESLSQARHERIRSLVAPVDKLLHDLQVLEVGGPRPPRCTGSRDDSPVNDEAKTGDAVVLGTLLKALIRSGLYPLPEPSSYTKSVSTLHTQLNLMRSSIQSLRLDMENPEYPWVLKHKGCNPSTRLWKTMDAAFKSPHFIITEKHKSHLKLQAKKSGILARQHATWAQQTEVGPYLPLGLDSGDWIFVLVSSAGGQEVLHCGRGVVNLEGELKTWIGQDPGRHHGFTLR
ncbi:hypothetical protein CONLIGDRAFT_223261 [Coniochaeta ligniaria NRRL 30616]|uniref:Uncharacterized protein n=1 Tax=Coniochaeta ligniaria NRRL 30616 TaxID=1408157 RepID=A0A1J7I4Y0_9PEZI|nr:hypothetical protein CONLIGDRAFT_223261 [Coniochaeta ligniaria NRRL 30616]